MHAMVMEPEIANLLGALSLAVMDRIEQGAREIIGHAGETPAARKQLAELIRHVLARQDTSEMDRFSICRMCDNGVCSNCPLPTTVSKRDR